MALIMIPFIDKFVFARDALLYIKDIIQSPGTFVVSVIFEIQFITEVRILTCMHTCIVLTCMGFRSCNTV